MNASEKKTCQRCGASVPATSPETLCPACLLSGALGPTGGPDATLSMRSGGGSPPYEPSAFPSPFGAYRLLGLLGRGGMGTVYEAEQRSTGRRLALKTLGHQLDSPDMRQRFLREGRLAARVNHPNSLFIFGSEEIEGLPVITMEIAAGGTLKDRLKHRGPLPVPEAVDAILDVVAGLESALAVGVLHRDVKPSNCFVCPDGSVKVGDFGLSVSTLTRTDTLVTAHGQIMGTPAFASPEQLRGDDLDVRADIYSVGATLFTLLTGRAPFEGENAVQVVANAVNQDPKPLAAFRDDVPARLERVVASCLAKEPARRFAGYPALRDALLPFSSREPEPASIKVRAAAGWIDFLIAFLPPYVALMFLVGSHELIVQPLVERTLYSARYYFLLFGCGFLYFGLLEGVWGAGLGKWLKGLRVVRPDGSAPGVARALVRILVPIGCVEGIRMPLMYALISDASWTGLQTALYVLAAVFCGWIPVVLVMIAREENGFATVWDRISGTRVLVGPKGVMRLPVDIAAGQEAPSEGAKWAGPYQVIGELVPRVWIIATDPMLRRGVWLLRRTAADPCVARRDVARPGRLRWLQKVETDEGAWDAFEAMRGVSFSSLVEGGKRVPWGMLRHWLYDMASELWHAAGDDTLPDELSMDHVWITAEGRAVLLDRPRPDVGNPAERIAVGDVAGQQRFLAALAACAESTSLPLHARGVVQNLEAGRFEKLSFLTGTLRGLLDRPAEVSRGIRAGSIFMLPLYVWIAFVVGRYHDKPWDDPVGIVVSSSVVVLTAIALLQFLGLPFRSTASHAIFRLAVVNAKGQPAARRHLLMRWAIVWLPLFLPVSCAAGWMPGSEAMVHNSVAVSLALWGAAAIYAVVCPNRGLHDRVAGTWVVRR